VEKTRAAAAAATSEEPVKKMEDNPSFTMRPNASFALHFLKEESAAAGRLTDSKKDESYKIQFLKMQSLIYITMGSTLYFKNI